MLLFWTLSFVAAVPQGAQYADTDMVSLMSKAVGLIKNYTTMDVLDKKVFGDQVHILVDSISHHSGDEFDVRMSKLANIGHITMVSHELGMDWPMEPFQIYERPKDPDDSKTAVSADTEHINMKREDGGERRIWNYPRQHCKGLPLTEDLFTSGSCFAITSYRAESSVIENRAGYSMHIAHYLDRYCTPHFRAGYYWLRGNTVTCYQIRENNSFWWDWPGRNSPF